jgi:hypothetical protein
MHWGRGLGGGRGSWRVSVCGSTGIRGPAWGRISVRRTRVIERPYPRIGVVGVAGVNGRNEAAFSLR